MGTDRLRRIVLGVLLVVLAFVLYRAWTSLETTATTSAAPGSPSDGKAAAPRSARAAPPAVTAPDVHLRALDEERPKPEPTERNLFRFKPKAPAPAPPRGAPPVGARPAPSVPAGPPPPPPIPLKFIGIVESGERSKKIAALVDPTGHPFAGGEGDVIAGQYRILKIGAESIEMSYLDGRGRQTIRMGGS